MARRKKIKLKDPSKVNDKPKNIRGLEKLEIGMEVMYRTPTLVDRCSVESIDKKAKTATLSNQVEVSLGILKDNYLLKIGNTTEQTLIKLWDSTCESEMEIFLAKTNVPKICNEIIRKKEKLSGEELRKIYKKLKSIEIKFLS